LELRRGIIAYDEEVKQARRRRPSSVTSIAVLLTMAAPLAGCLAVTTLDGKRLRLSSPDFPAYAERVFRAQNRVATDLAFALEAPELEPADTMALEAAEQTLLDACAGLNEVATERRDGQAAGRVRAARAARRVPDCERATAEATTAIAAAAASGDGGI
jgi:hypothetical protein